MPRDLSSVPFAKVHGCGNDYVLVDARGFDAVERERLLQAAPALAVRVADRRTGIGGDGLVLLVPAPGLDARLAMWNADGSRGAVCGTALRCAAERVVAAGELLPDEVVRLASDAGPHAARVRPDGPGRARVRVTLPAPQFDAASIPLDPERCRVLRPGDGAPWEVELEAGGERFEGLALATGNPHLVLPVVAPPGELDLALLGPALERHAAFPDRVNVHFVRPAAGGPRDGAVAALDHAIWERGSGATRSCGSGACAVAVAAVHLGLARRGEPVLVHQPGGALEAAWLADGGLELAGPAEVAFEGVLRL